MRTVRAMARHLRAPFLVSHAHVSGCGNRVACHDNKKIASKVQLSKFLAENFDYFSTHQFKCVLGLIEYPQQMFRLRNKKNHFNYTLLSGSLASSYVFGTYVLIYVKSLLFLV